MTTIAYRNGIMASDTRAYSGGKLGIGFKAKTAIVERDGGERFLVGVSSSAPGFGEHVINWWLAGANIHEFPPIPEGGFTLLAVDEAGQGFYMNDLPYISGPLTADYWAIGSGDLFAAGVMEVGGSATLAVQTAAKLDPWTGGEIVEISFPPRDDK